MACQNLYPCSFAVKGAVTVGSGPDCDISLPAGQQVAEQHLRIESQCIPGQLTYSFVLEALNPEYPVFVDGNNTRKRRIDPGCVLSIGSCRYRFEADGLYPVAPGGVVRVRYLSGRRPGLKRDTLRRVAFAVRSGEMLGIFGPSGCGKSTLIDCLRGELQPTGGRVEISHGLKTGFVPQENLLYDRLTVDENLCTSAVVRMPDLDAASIKRHVDRVLKVIGLDKPEDRSKLAHDLSGGMRKRVNVALELLDMPQILMLDEPTSGLDPATQADFMAFLRELSNRCVTVICVTHALETLDRFDRLILLRKLAVDDTTSMIFRGTPDELHAKYNDEQMVRLFDASSGVVEESVMDDMDDPEDGLAGEPSDVGSLPAKRPFGPAVQMTFLRTWLNLRRNPLNAMMVFALPAILGALIFFAQAPFKDNNWFKAMGSMSLTLTISALWLGMNLMVREIVAERPVCHRELRVGLNKLEYLAGKALYAALFTAIQALLIALVLYGLSRWQPLGLGETAGLSPFGRSGFWLGRGVWLALFACSFSGALIGLAVSSISKTQALAVTLIPLFLIPHLLFNRNVAGDIETVDKSDVYCPIKNAAWTQDVRERIHLIGSVTLISRPAMNLMLSGNVDADIPDDVQRNVKVFGEWRGLEWGYLLTLLAWHMLFLLLAFGYCSRTADYGIRGNHGMRFCSNKTKGGYGNAAILDKM